MANEIPKGDFCITIDFDKNSPNPERVFIAMTNLITSFKKLDDNLIQSIDKTIQPVLMLEDIETGSLKTWLKQALMHVNDDALKTLDWKPLVGQYLVKAKYIVLNFLEKRTKVSNASELKVLQGELYQVAEETNVNRFPAYTPISIPKLIDNLDRLNQSLDALQANDKAYFNSTEGDATFNMDFDFVPEEIEDLMTKEVLENTNTMILKVKRPDYLGSAQWELKHEKRTILAKILHEEWLLAFQRRQKDVRPGDALRAVVKTTVKYGFDMNVVSSQYEILEVLDIIRDETFPNPLFNDEEEE